MKNLFIVAFMMFAGCKHAEPKMTEEARPTPKAAPSGPTGPRGAEQITTSRTTKQMFKAEGLKKLQAALDKSLKDVAAKNAEIEDEKQNVKPKTKEAATQAEKNEHKVELQPVDSVEQTGDLDGPTQESLRAFQRSEHLPETGLPDYETLRRLKIRPEEVYHRDPPSERVGVP